METEESDKLVPDDASTIVSIKSITNSKVRTTTRYFQSSSPVKLANSARIPLFKRLIFLLVISFSCLAAINCSNMFFPFFSNFAESNKLVEPDVIGNIVGILYFGVFAFCIIFGIFIKRLGPKYLYFSGYLILSSALFLFGFIDRMNTTWFIVYSFILIIVMSYSLAAIYTASYSIGMALFPNNQNTVLAVIDTIAGVGYTTGPIFGGLIFDKFGWFWVYFANAIFVFVGCVISIFLLPFIKIEKVESESIMDYLNIFRLLPNINILSVMLVNMVITIGWSYQYTSFGPFLERTYNSSSETIGYVFAVPNISYTILLPILGILSERTVSRLFIWLSLPVLIIALILTPPLCYIFTDRPFVQRPGINTTLLPLSPSTSDTNYLSVTVIGQILIGAAYTLAYAPMYVDMKRNVSEKTKKKLSNLAEVLSSIRIGTYFLANGMGPIISGIIEENLSFDDETFIFILVACATFLIFTPLSIGNVIFVFLKRRKLSLDMF